MGRRRECKKAPFVRVLPKYFSVKDVTYVRKRQGCYFRVRYNFENGDDLPTGPGLKVLVNQIKKYSPCNTTIVADYGPHNRAPFKYLKLI